MITYINSHLKISLSIFYLRVYIFTHRKRKQLDQLVYNFYYVFSNVFYVFRRVFCCLFSVFTAHGCRNRQGKNYEGGMWNRAGRLGCSTVSSRRSKFFLHFRLQAKTLRRKVLNLADDLQRPDDIFDGWTPPCTSLTRQAVDRNMRSDEFYFR